VNIILNIDFFQLIFGLLYVLGVLVANIDGGEILRKQIFGNATDSGSTVQSPPISNAFGLLQYLDQYFGVLDIRFVEIFVAS